MEINMIPKDLGILKQNITDLSDEEIKKRQTLEGIVKAQEYLLNDFVFDAAFVTFPAKQYNDPKTVYLQLDRGHVKKFKLANEVTNVSMEDNKLFFSYKEFRYIVELGRQTFKNL